MDDNGSMWQISIEGSKVRVGNTAPTVTYLNNPASVAWKSDFMVAGDGDGGLFLCDAKTSQVRCVSTAAVEPLNNGHVGTSYSVHCREVSSLWRLEMYVHVLELL